MPSSSLAGLPLMLVDRACMPPAPCGLAGTPLRHRLEGTVSSALPRGNTCGEVLPEVDGAVAVVTPDGPERRDALTPGMARELIGLFDEVEARSQVGALVVRAAGTSF